jgi:branched-chain amino acid transport system substrate-binding protein
MLGFSASAYDIVRFIVSDAVKRAGTMETDAVIKALEKTSVETTLARRFSFTSDHDMLVEEAGMTSLVDSSMLYIVMQWQNGTQVPVFPEALRIEADGTIKLPPWQGPWSR